MTDRTAWGRVDTRSLIFSVQFELLSDGRREHFTAALKRVDQDDGATEKESSGVAVGWPAFALTWVLLKTAGGNWTSWRTTWSVVRQATSPMTGWRDSSCSAAEMDSHTSKDTLTVLHSPFNRHRTNHTSDVCFPAIGYDALGCYFNLILVS